MRWKDGVLLNRKVVHIAQVELERVNVGRVPARLVVPPTRPINVPPTRPVIPPARPIIPPPRPIVPPPRPTIPPLCPTIPPPRPAIRAVCCFLPQNARMVPVHGLGQSSKLEAILSSLSMGDDGDSKEYDPDDGYTLAQEFELSDYRWF